LKGNIQVTAFNIIYRRVDHFCASACGHLNYRAGLRSQCSNGFNPRKQLLRDSVGAIAFIMLLGLMASLPGFGVDMALPAFADTAAYLGVPTSYVGLTISSYMISFGIAPLILGPVSDRHGRKAVVTFGCTIFILAGVGSALASSLALLITYRMIQGIGAAAMTLALVIARDSFVETVVRKKISYIVMAIYISPIAAPIVGAALLGFGGWRSIYAALVALGVALLIGVRFGLDDDPRRNPVGRLNLLAVVGDYGRLLSHPIARAYMAVAAASFGVVAAYATGSSLFFIQVKNMSPDQYALLFGLTALASIAGAFLDSRLSARGISPLHPLWIGLTIVVLASSSLLAMALIGWMPVPAVVVLFMTITFGGGIAAPGITQGTLQQLPQMAGTVNAATNFLAMTAGSLSSAFTTLLFDGRTGISMAGIMTFCAFLSLICFWTASRHARRHTIVQSREA
jgi:DHA1 family bicyclomycin/chloramphenicol resistance-like MFS transporter